MYDLIILGAGPAGSAAAVYAARKRIKTLLITESFGGQSVNSATIENWIGFVSISGIEFSQALEKHVRAQEGIDIKDGVRATVVRDSGDSFDVVLDNGETVRGRKLFYGLGSSYRRLNIPGERDYEGKGVFYCSICDAPLMNGKPAAVIGGGNSGLEAAIDLLPYATDVYLLEYSGALKGDAVYQERLKRESNVHIITNAQTTAITGDVFVSGLTYRDVVSGEEKSLAVNGIFVQIGMVPNVDLVRDLVELDASGRIAVDHKTFRTSHPRIWAAGDVVDGLYNQINPAMGDAVKAVLSIYADLLNK